MTATLQNRVLTVEDPIHTHELFAEYCQILRNQLLVEIMLGNSEERIITLSFSGDSDSGTWDDQHENPLVQNVFDYLQEHHVTWNWWNNDGGGGSITWDLEQNTIEIKGYIRYIQHRFQLGAVLVGDNLEEHVGLEPEEEAA